MPVAVNRWFAVDPEGRLWHYRRRVAVFGCR